MLIAGRLEIIAKGLNLVEEEFCGRHVAVVVGGGAFRDCCCRLLLLVGDDGSRRRVDRTRRGECTVASGGGGSQQGQVHVLLGHPLSWNGEEEGEL